MSKIVKINHNRVHLIALNKKLSNEEVADIQTMKDIGMHYSKIRGATGYAEGTLYKYLGRQSGEVKNIYALAHRMERTSKYFSAEAMTTPQKKRKKILA